MGRSGAKAVLYLALLAGAGATLPAGPPAGAGVGLQATSGDGRLVLQVQAEPPCLLVFDRTRGEPLQVIVPAARDGRVASRMAALRTAPLRRSFVVAPADLPELWEISYDPRAEEIYDGLVHDYRFGEGVPRRGYLGIRRTALPEPLADFVLDADEAEAWGLAAAPPAGSGEGQVINLDVRRRVAVRPAIEIRAAMALRKPLEGTSLPAADVASTPRPPAESAQWAPSSERAQAVQSPQRRTASRPWPCAPPNVRAP